MNKKLKSRIFEVYGTQYEFSKAVDVHETLVSRVVRGSREIPDAEKKRWATFLNADAEEIFAGGRSA